MGDFKIEERLNEVISLWNYSLTVCASNIFEKDAPYVFLEVGRAAIDKLKEAGVVLVKDTPADTLNAVYSYFSEHGYFKDARARDTGEKFEGRWGILELYEKWPVDFDSCCWAIHNDAFNSHACFCYNVIRYALNAGFGLDLKFLGSEFRKDAGEVFIKAALVPASQEVVKSLSLLKQLGRCSEDRERVSHGFRRAIEMSLDAIVSADQYGRIILWNPAAEKITGYSGKEAKGLSIDILVPDEYRERHRTSMERFLSKGESMLIGKVTETEALRKDGTRFPIEMSLSSEKVDERWVFTAVIRDITGRKKLEDELRKRLLDMERINKLMVGREMRMEELREEIRELRSKIQAQGK